MQALTGALPTQRTVQADSLDADGTSLIKTVGGQQIVAEVEQHEAEEPEAAVLAALFDQIACLNDGGLRPARVEIIVHEIEGGAA